MPPLPQLANFKFTKNQDSLTDVLMKDNPAPIPDIAAACEAQTQFFLMLLPNISSRNSQFRRTFFLVGSPIAIASPSLIRPHPRTINSRQVDNNFSFPRWCIRARNLITRKYLIFLFSGQVTKRSSTGLLAAAFTAIVPSYISRSVGGSYDNEGVAIFALIFVFYLWIKSVNTGSMMWGCLTVSRK